jgi:hypothetical protein
MADNFYLNGAQSGRDGALQSARACRNRTKLEKSI